MRGTRSRERSRSHGPTSRSSASSRSSGASTCWAGAPCGWSCCCPAASGSSSQSSSSRASRSRSRSCCGRSGTRAGRSSGGSGPKTVQQALPPRCRNGEDLLARRRLVIGLELLRGLGREIELDSALVDRGDALSGDVPRSRERAGRDGKTVEDVLPAVADHGVDLAERTPVVCDDTPAGLDQQPRYWIRALGQTERPPMYQTGPWVSTAFVSERARRIRTSPRMPRSSSRSRQRRTISGDAPYPNSRAERNRKPGRPP